MRCPSRHIAKDACPGSFIAVDRLEQMVLAELKRLSDRYLDKDALAERVSVNAGLQEQKARLQAGIAAYRKRINEYAKGLRELYMDKVKGVIAEADFIGLSASLSEEKKRLTMALEEAGRQLAAIEEHLQAGDNRRALIERYTNMERLTRGAVEILIDYIAVGKRIPGTRDVPFEIHWNF